MGVCALTLLAATLFPGGAADDAKSVLEKLQGTWVCVAAEDKGDKFTEAEAKEESFVIKGDKITYLRKGRARGEKTFTIDPSKKPAAIYFLDEDGKKNHAIYALEGDELKLRVNGRFQANNADEAPKDFSTKVGNSALLWVLKRQKK